MVTKRKLAGFTLIEVIVGIALLAIAFVVLGQLAGSLNLFQLSQAETQKASFAKNYLDLLRSDWARDENYTAGVLPFRTPPAGHSYSLEVRDTESDTLIVSFTHGGTLPPLLNDTSPMRSVMMTVTDSRGGSVSLTARLSRPRLR